MALYEVPFWWFTGFETGIVSAPSADGIDENWLGVGQSAHADAAKDGLYGLKCAPVAQQAYLGSAGFGTMAGEFTSQVVGTFHARIVTPIAGATPTEIAVGRVVSGGGEALIRYDPTSGKLEALFEGGTAQEGPEIVVGEWFHIDVRVTLDYDTGTDTLSKTIEWRVDEVDYPDAIQVITIISNPWVGDLILGPGWNGVVTCEIHYDNFGVGFETATYYTPVDEIHQGDQYPYGPIVVSRLLPVGMGTHNNPTHFTEEDASAIDADTWNKLDEWPPDVSGSADGVRQVTLNADSYVEIEFEPTRLPDDRILAVRPAGAIRRPSGSGSGRVGTKGAAGAYGDWIYCNTGAYSPTDGRQLVGSGGSFGVAVAFVDTWTKALVNDFRLRYGFSNDITPELQLDAVMLEVASTPLQPRVPTEPLSIPATLAHQIHRGPRSRTVRVADFRALKAASGGWMSCTAQVPASEVRDNPSVLATLAHWYARAKETGATLFHGQLKTPATHGGVIDLSATGPGGKLLQAVRRLFYASFGTGGWIVQEALPFSRGLSPKTAPSAALDGAGNVEVGVHHYKVTFVTAAGETRPGPRVEIDVITSAKTVALTQIPIGPKYVTGRKIYRTTAGSGTYGLLTTINDNTTRTFSDSVADGSLGASPPSSFHAAEIETNIKPGVLNFHVARGATVNEGQRKSFLFPLSDDEKVSRLEIDIERSRDAAGYSLRILTGDDQDSTLTVEETISLDDDGPQSVPWDLAAQSGLVAVELIRDGATVTNADPLDVDIVNIKVFGRARTSNFTASDLVRNIFSEHGISNQLVRESGVDVLPLDFQGGTYMDPLWFAQLVTGWCAGVTRPYLSDIGHFRPYEAKIWTATHPFPTKGLHPEEPASRAVVKYTEVGSGDVDYVSAVADPNPLGRIVDAPLTELDRPASKDVARAIAQQVADYSARPGRYSGQDVHATLKLGGRIYSAKYCEGGDCIYYPDAGVTLHVEEAEIAAALVTTTYPRGVPVIDKINAKRGIGRRS